MQCATKQRASIGASELAAGLQGCCTLCCPRESNVRRRGAARSALCASLAARNCVIRHAIVAISTDASSRAFAPVTRAGKMKLLTLLFAGAAALAPTPAKNIKATKPAALPYQVAAAATAFAPV